MKIGIQYSFLKTLGRVAATSTIVPFLFACAATGSNYRPAEEPGEVGYKQRQLSDQRYRVTFTGGIGNTLAEVQDYALRRAAELTLAQDFDYFEVENRSTIPVDDTTYSSSGAVAYRTTASGSTYNDCGLLGCETYDYPGAITQQEYFPPIDDSYVTSLEILMLGDEGEDSNYYDASAVLRQLDEL